MNPTILIIEDDKSDALELEMLLQNFESYDVSIAKNLNDAYAFIQENKVDTIILDLFLNNVLVGIDFLDAVNDLKIPFIVCTGYRDESIFNILKKYNPEAYLIKPIEKLTFFSALYRIKELKLKSLEENDTDTIIIKQDKKLYKLAYSDIIAINSEGNYCKLMTHSKNYISRLKISDLEDKLPNPLFLRVHRNAIVNSKKMVSIDISNQVIFLKNNIEISFAKKHSDIVEKAFLS